jgi:hypothetical protein
MAIYALACLDHLNLFYIFNRTIKRKVQGAGPRSFRPHPTPQLGQTTTTDKFSSEATKYCSKAVTLLYKET